MFTGSAARRVRFRATAIALAGLVLVVVTSVAAAGPERPAWVAASDAHARFVLDAQAAFAPEAASSYGLVEHDGRTVDLGPRLTERYLDAMEKVTAELRRRLDGTTDPHVRQDLEILLTAVDNDVTGARLGARLFLEWYDVPKLVFEGIRGLLEDQVAPERRGKALARLERYVGRAPDTVPVATLAKARFDESLAPGRLGPYRADRLGPYKPSVEEAIANAPTYLKGIRDLFARYAIPNADAALAALDAQIADYVAWERDVVLPRSRTDFRQPPEFYAHLLKVTGIDVDPRVLIERARLAFADTRTAMQMLAPRVAAAKGIDARDYRDVLRALKRETIPDARLEAHYATVNRDLEAVIRRERIVTLPSRPMVVRLASEAESAAQPAPHMEPPPLVGNTGERGQFVLPVGNPSAGGQAYDDFNFAAAAWTLSAHEGRPGHELQFSAMLERGVSLARSIFAFTSVNVEGWALYAEAEMMPHEPIEGQLVALQHRLMRAARAMLDPMLNLGLIEPEAARAVLREEVVLSPAMVRQELDRYTFRAPGQAGSYFYGYARLQELRVETELALGKHFDRMAFNDFVLAQGLVPPALLARAVREELIAAHGSERPRPPGSDLTRGEAASTVAAP